MFRGVVAQRTGQGQEAKMQPHTLDSAAVQRSSGGQTVRRSTSWGGHRVDKRACFGGLRWACVRAASVVVVQEAEKGVK
jgi:hypothetical protein